MAPAASNAGPVTVSALNCISSWTSTATAPILEPAPGHGGLQLAAWFRDPGTDDRAVASALAAGGFGVQALSTFHLGPPRPGLLFGIAGASPEKARAAATLIRRLLG